MSFDATALQRALAAHEPPYDPGPIDGVFGLKTQAAMQAFEEANDLPVTEKPVAAVYIALGLQVPDFAPPAPPAPKASNPITDYLTQLAIQAVLANLKGRLPMLTGYKTYATAAVLGLIAAYSLIFGDLPLVGHVDPGSALMAILSSLGLGFARTGAKTEAAKATGQQ